MREHLLDRIAMTLSADVQWTFQVRRCRAGRAAAPGQPGQHSPQGHMALNWSAARLPRLLGLPRYRPTMLR